MDGRNWQRQVGLVVAGLALFLLAANLLGALLAEPRLSTVLPRILVVVIVGLPMAVLWLVAAARGLPRRGALFALLGPFGFAAAASGLWHSRPLLCRDEAEERRRAELNRLIFALGLVVVAVSLACLAALPVAIPYAIRQDEGHEVGQFPSGAVASLAVLYLLVIIPMSCLLAWALSGAERSTPVAILLSAAAGLVILGIARQATGTAADLSSRLIGVGLGIIVLVVWVEVLVLSVVGLWRHWRGAIG